MEKQENKSKDQTRSKKRTLAGVVVSSAMDKTIVIKVMSVKVHSRYKKRVFTGKRYKAHDEKNAFKDGDQATIIECRPLSKEKHWRVVYPPVKERGQAKA